MLHTESKSEQELNDHVQKFLNPKALPISNEMLNAGSIIITYNPPLILHNAR